MCYSLPYPPFVDNLYPIIMDFIEAIPILHNVIFTLYTKLYFLETMTSKQKLKLYYKI